MKAQVGLAQLTTGLATGYSPMTGGSDYLPFTNAGKPGGGLAAGAAAIKSTTQRAEYEGAFLSSSLSGDPPLC